MLKGHSVIPCWCNTQNKTAYGVRGKPPSTATTVPWGTPQSPLVFSLSGGVPRSAWPRTPPSLRSVWPPSYWWSPPGPGQSSNRSLHPALGTPPPETRGHVEGSMFMYKWHACKCQNSLCSKGVFWRIFECLSTKLLNARLKARNLKYILNGYSVTHCGISWIIWILTAEQLHCALQLKSTAVQLCCATPSQCKPKSSPVVLTCCATPLYTSWGTSQGMRLTDVAPITSLPRAA